MRFLVDECLPPSLAAQLRAAGHDAVSVVGLGLAGAVDLVVMEVARDQQRVLVWLTRISASCSHGAMTIIRASCSIAVRRSTRRCSR
ncbi:MAG: DUF5615 family PIN-like protein [Pseudonocardia sp.]|nr:DUF5615 family PIN-like protein [Pseudonocardia sp.]